MRQVSIPQDLAQALHDYLMERPMGEVEHLVTGIRLARPVPPTREDAPMPETAE